METRVDLIDKALQQAKRELEKQAEKIGNLEAAARQRFAESDGQMLCPSCESNKVVRGDYLCEDCRYG